MQIVAMMLPDINTGKAEESLDNHPGNRTNPAHTASVMSEQDAIRICQLAEEEDFAQQMQMRDGESDTEEADYDSSESDVGVTAKIKMAWHPRTGTRVTVIQHDTKPSAEDLPTGCGRMAKRPAAQQDEQDNRDSSDKSDSDKSNHLDSDDAKILTKLQSQENAEIESSDKAIATKVTTWILMTRKFLQRCSHKKMRN